MISANERPLKHSKSFFTIRQVASMGVLPEHCLRRLSKEGILPSIKTGNRVLINLDQLLRQLDDGSLQQLQRQEYKK